MFVGMTSQSRVVRFDIQLQQQKKWLARCVLKVRIVTGEHFSTQKLNSWNAGMELGEFLKIFPKTLTPCHVHSNKATGRLTCQTGRRDFVKSHLSWPHN